MLSYRKLRIVIVSQYPSTSRRVNKFYLESSHVQISASYQPREFFSVSKWMRMGMQVPVLKDQLRKTRQVLHSGQFAIDQLVCLGLLTCFRAWLFYIVVPKHNFLVRNSNVNNTVCTLRDFATLLQSQCSLLSQASS